MGWLALVWLWSGVGPGDREIWLIENLLVVAYFSLLIGTYRRFQFSNLSYAMFGLFMTMHLIGSHYTYAEVPLGRWLGELLGEERNHYDRIVHFSFGLLLAYPMREALIRAAGLRVSWSYFTALCGILGFSVFYELLEAFIVFLFPESEAPWLCTQGDEWDSQKDSAVAFAGGIIAMVTTWAIYRMRRASPQG